MEIIKGNLIDLAQQGRFNVIIHGANCFNTMSSGIAKEIRARYPKAYEVDCETVAGDRAKLGTYTTMLGLRFNIINAYTQYGYGRKTEDDDLFEYEAFALILERLQKQYKGVGRFGFPLIGCGLAGGDKTRIVGMIEDFAKAVEADGSTVTIVEFG
jgi:O-acetyl-ADP-ribose deacetylase (regulator of RNase III)